MVSYQLTPAYDLLSTALVLPDDTEELALTLCGKKRKLTRDSFVEAMQKSGLNDKVIANIFKKFERTADKWYDFIRRSFLPADMQEQYIAIIRSNLAKI